MAREIGALIAFVIVFGIPYLISKKEEKKNAEKIADEFMRFHFGDDYKDKMNRR